MANERVRKPAARSIGALTTIIGTVVTPELIESSSVRDLCLSLPIGDTVIELDSSFYAAGALHSSDDFSIEAIASEGETFKCAVFPSSLPEFITLRTSIPKVLPFNARMFGRIQFVMKADVLTPLPVAYTVYLRGSPNRSVTDYFNIAGTSGSHVKFDFQMIDTITNMSAYTQAYIEIDLDNWFNRADLISCDFTFQKLSS